MSLWTVSTAVRIEDYSQQKRAVTCSISIRERFLHAYLLLAARPFLETIASPVSRFNVAAAVSWAVEKPFRSRASSSVIKSPPAEMLSAGRKRWGGHGR